MKSLARIFLIAVVITSVRAQSPVQRTPDVSNKALITKQTPIMMNQKSGDPALLRKLADDYYAWRNENYPVRSSEAGLHTWDNRLTDYSSGKMAGRAAHVRQLLDQVRAMKTESWAKDDRIDWILFRSQLEEVEFGDRVLHFETNNPLVYVGECSNGIFSLLKKEYDTPHNRALSATARMKAMPTMIAQGERNLHKPVKLYAQLAIQSARSIDPLFKESMNPLIKELSDSERSDFEKARDEALSAIHGFADHLEKRLPQMIDFAPMGEANYNYYLKHILLLPLDAVQVEMLGRAELARYHHLILVVHRKRRARPITILGIFDNRAGVHRVYRRARQAGGSPTLRYVHIHRGCQSRPHMGRPAHGHAVRIRAASQIKDVPRTIHFAGHNLRDRRIDIGRGRRMALVLQVRKLR